MRRFRPARRRQPRDLTVLLVAATLWGCGLLFACNLACVKMIISLDLETTGTNPLVDRPVRLALVGETGKDRRILMNSLINPHMEISEGASAIHGITQQQVATAPDAAIAAWAAEGLVRDLAPTAVVGFNSETYDLPMLSACLGREMSLPCPHLDVLAVAYRFFPTQPSHKLTALYQDLVGWPLDGAHDAVADATATLELLRAINVKLGMTLKQLVEEMAEPKPHVLFPFGVHKGKLIEEIPSSYGRWALGAFTNIRPDLLVTLEAIAGGR